MQVLSALALTKVGFLVMIVPWLVAGAVGTVTGLAGFAVVATSMAGAAMWGYGYGVIQERSNHE